MLTHFNIIELINKTCLLTLGFHIMGRGTGEWRKGQHSWNISVTNEVRGGAKGTVGIVQGMPFSLNLFFLLKNIAKTDKYTSY